MSNSKILIFLAALALASCSHRSKYFDASIPDAHIDYVRFDKALLSLTEADSIQTRAGVEEMYIEYPTFTATFTEDVLGIPMEDTAYLCHVLPQFLSDTLYGFRQTNDRCLALFGDDAVLEEQVITPLARAFGRLHHLYPDWHIPTLYFYVSGFNAALFLTEDEDVAIGLDMYLGSDYEYYNRVVYDYQKYMMRPECIPMDVVSACLGHYIPYTSPQNRLIDKMIYRGKIMWLLSELFDNPDEWEVIGYRKEQYDWAKRNEAAIWQMMIDKKDLWKTEQLVLTSYLNDGPFTSEISQDAPARLGIWMGMRIVRSYMANNDVSIAELMLNGDSQQILEDSNYRP